MLIDSADRRERESGSQIIDIEYCHDESSRVIVKCRIGLKTRPDTRLPKSLVGGQGQ